MLVLSAKPLALLLCKEQSDLEEEGEANLVKPSSYTALLDTTQALPYL